MAEPGRSAMQGAGEGCLTIGLTGGIGSGKSAAADYFAQLGAHVIDTDVIARALTAPQGAAIGAIRSAFGDALISPDGALDRAAMRRRVFADATERQRLEAILHPMIRERCEQALAAVHSGYALLVVPLLAESTYFRQRCQRIAVVDCPEAQQIARVMQRSGLSADEVRAIVAAQTDAATRLRIADDVLDNAGDLAHLQRQVHALHQRYLLCAGKTQQSQRNVL